MKLSIITINYNNLDGLKRTYESVASQSCQDFEWIVIDGGSTDGSKEFIEEHQAQFDYWCSEPDKGVYNAMNKGVATATGEYVNFMNSGDSFYETQTIANVLACECDADVWYGDAIYDCGTHRETKIYPKKLSCRWLYYQTLNHQTVFCKTEILRNYPFDETFRLMADRKLWLMLYMHGFVFRHLSLIIAIYDTSGISATNGGLWLEEINRIQAATLTPFFKWNKRISRILMFAKIEIKRIIIRIYHG